MVTIITGAEHKICAHCNPPIIKMEQLPHLKDIYICPNCSGFEYLVEGQGRVLEEEDLEQEYDS